MVAAVLVTRLVERCAPESVAGIAGTALVSALAMWLLSSGGFALLYLWQDARIAGLIGAGQGAGHFLRLGAKAALIWGPLVAITVATAPRRWKTATW